jgi:mono/diheme cytochrome c family protein
MKTRIIAAVVVLLCCAGFAAYYVTRLDGLSTRTPPSAVERVLAQAVRRWSMPRVARTMTNPVPYSDDVWASSRAHFADHCATCHSNDGSGTTEMAQHFYPRTPDLRQPDTQNLSDGELYWIIENGVRLTGMPAWGEGGWDDTETWHLVHFIRKVRDLTPGQIEEMEALNPRTPLELQEEQEDRQFLNGGDDASAQPPDANTQKKE